MKKRVALIVILFTMFTMLTAGKGKIVGNNKGNDGEFEWQSYYVEYNV